ncbi:hypothetical protein Tsubulata_025179 [Turnera subulata]|uniref:DUF4283 domain-containing protein n=1 Tax=Turnera subulata TaxID=218843 RepID=A0A9Q0FBI9_9ROSI|nr:hypothetical protein Tsubulata_025179 [Turnera subulata]
MSNNSQGKQVVVEEDRLEKEVMSESGVERVYCVEGLGARGACGGIEKGLNIFQFSFKEADDRGRVLWGCPWTFSGNHLVLKDSPPNKTMEEVDLTWFDFFVLLYVPRS